MSEKRKSSEALVVGQCQECSGDMTIPTIWFGTCEPTPSCARCSWTGATEEATVVSLDSDDSLDAVLSGPAVSVKLW